MKPMTPTDPMRENYEAVEFFGKPALFINVRVDRSMLPPGLFHYDIQHTDKGGMIPSVIKENVNSGYFGSVILNEPLMLSESRFGDYKLMDDKDLSFLSEARTIPEYQRSCPSKHPEHKYPALVEKQQIPEHYERERFMNR